MKYFTVGGVGRQVGDERATDGCRESLDKMNQLIHLFTGWFWLLDDSCLTTPA